MNRAGQITHVLLRIVAGFLFMQHGGQKLFGWYGGGGGAGASLPPMTLQNKGETAALFSFIFCSPVQKYPSQTLGIRNG